MATERFAGGRGMAFATQVNIKANPFENIKLKFSVPVRTYQHIQWS
jgi:hypothetical protein